MKTKYFFSFIVFSFCIYSHAEAQPNIWDIPATEALIAHNKTNFADNKAVKNNQLKSTLTVGILKNTKDKCKRLIDSLDKRLNSLYIILADAVLAIQVSNIMRDILEYQGESFQLVLKYPYASFLYYNNQQKIIDDARSVFSLIYMVILSYGDIGKMKVSERKIVYTQIVMQLGYLRAKCSALNEQLKMIDFSETYKNSGGFRYIDMDKDKVNQIINDWKH
ncbi:MAG: hypothetical protein M3Z26_06425 [Bacteroidota bacterium]|nr:hypothetical protein [Bacteroidota bacterium]